MLIDDYIPCIDGRPAFSSANGNELWVIILEKAWAKLHGSYERIVGGQAHHTLRDLLGAPAYEFATSLDDTWEKILDADKRDYIMAAGVSEHNSEDTERLTAIGLVAGHSYGLIAAAQVLDRDGKLVNIVQLRNPWG